MAVADPTLEFAIKLEAMFPRVIRAIFASDPSDPLMDLQIAQIRVMRTLFRGDRTVSDLSEEFGLSMSACTQMINRLEAMGLVDRRGDSDDRRIRHIGLSEKGLAQMKERQRLRVSRAQQTLQNLTAEEQERIVWALERLLLEAGTISGRGDSLTTTAELEQALPVMPPYSPQDASA